MVGLRVERDVEMEVGDKWRGCECVQESNMMATERQCKTMGKEGKRWMVSDARDVFEHARIHKLSIYILDVKRTSNATYDSHQ